MTTYVVCDIEADGPIPGPHSMISLGAVAVNREGKELGDFEPRFPQKKKNNKNQETDGAMPC